MAVYSILPNTNLKPEDIRDTLNANGGSVSNDCNTFFSTEANIWKWSRRKPIIHTELFTLTDAMLKSKNFGLTIPSGNSDAITAAGREYTYTLPAGGISQPKRMGDFRNYNPKAVAPCKSAGSFTVSGNLTTKNFILPINLDGDTYNIGANELNSLKDYYLALVIKYTYGGSTYITYKTDSQTIGTTGGMGVVYNLTTDLPFSLGVESMTYYWLAATYAKTGADEPFQQIFYALPFPQATDCTGTISVEGGGIGLQFSATGIMQYYDSAYVDNIKDYQKSDSPLYFRISNSGTMYIEYTVKNNSSSSKTVELGGGSAGAKSTGTARPSFAASQPAPTTGAVPLQWYIKEGAKWVQRTGISVAANSSVLLRVGTDNWLAYKNGVDNLCAEGLKFQTSIAIKLPDSNLPAQVIYLRT